MKYYTASACGNKFVIIDTRTQKLEIENIFSSAKNLCARDSFDVDGILLLQDSKKADVFMHIINSDGSIASMCGNGVRCVAQHLSNFAPQKQDFFIETLSGIKRVQVLKNDGSRAICMAQMGGAKVKHMVKFFDCIQRAGEYDIVDVGNKHAVFFPDPQIGRKKDQFYSLLQGEDGINVEFVEEIDDKKIRARVFERGCGETASCGSGAMAIGFSLNSRGYGSCFDICMPGGELNVKVLNGQGFLIGESLLSEEKTLQDDKIL